MASELTDYLRSLEPGCLEDTAGLERHLADHRLAIDEQYGSLDRQQETSRPDDAHGEARTLQGPRQALG